MKIKDTGELNRLTTIEIRSTAQNSNLEEIESWSTHKTAWAAITSGSSGRTSQEADESGKEVNKHIIELTYSYESVKSIYKAMPKDYRIVYDGQTFDILGYNEEGFRDFISFTCRYAN